MNHFFRMHGLVGSLNKQKELGLLRKIANMELHVELGHRAQYAKGLVYDKFDGWNEHSRAKIDMSKTTVKGALAVGASSAEVRSIEGFEAGQEVTVYDYATSERVLIELVELTGETDWKQVVAGDNHSLAIKNDGSLWAWGINSIGHLGDGTTTSPVKAPKKIGVDTDWKQVVAGTSHSLAIKNDGSLWAWGSSANGQLGDGAQTTVTEPKKIGVDTEWKQVVAGTNHSVALKNDGSLWAWGRNTEGQLGDGTTTTPVTAPKKIGTATDWKQVVAGGNHNLAIKNDGSLWAWGQNINGQIGDGTTTTPVTAPKKIGTGTDWKQVVAGSSHNLAIKNDGSLWAWGANTYGQVGDGTVTTPVTAPKRIGTDIDWKQVIAGALHSLALKNDGSLWVWGRNNRGQVGDGSTESPISAPKKIGTDTDWKQVVEGGSFSEALKNDGSLWAWGDNSFGQLGDGTTEDRHTPTGINVAYTMTFDTPIQETYLDNAGIARTNAEVVDGELVFGTWDGNTYEIAEVN